MGIMWDYVRKKFLDIPLFTAGMEDLSKLFSETHRNKYLGSDWYKHLTTLQLCSELMIFRVGWGGDKIEVSTSRR